MKYCIGMDRKDWISLVDVIQRIYYKCLDNRESFTAIGFINSVRNDILSIFILTGIQQLALWFNNSIDEDIAVAIAETRYPNDRTSLQWVKHFKKYSANKKQDIWCLLLMDCHRLHHKCKFIKFCEDHKVKIVGMLPNNIHLWQSLDVYAF